MRKPNINRNFSEEVLTFIPIDPVLSTQSQKSLFWRPNYLEKSAWLEHVPFAFWLIENHKPKVFVELGSHYGTSYFAFCQAVERLSLATACYAVDNWKGDEHAGFYGPEVFAKVQAHNNANYLSFSNLIKSDFDSASPYFTDKSIDLLHIDGLHNYEAVLHDYEAWLPKLSDNAIVIFHDTNVKRSNFGVFKLFEKLASKYPSFEFLHGHGLGLVGVGENQNSTMAIFFELSQNTDSKNILIEVFSRVGKSCNDIFLSQKYKIDYQNKLKEVERIKGVEAKLLSDITISKEVIKGKTDRVNLLEKEASAKEKLYSHLDSEYQQSKKIKQELTQ